MKVAFGGAIAVVLLGLYAYAVVDAVWIVLCEARSTCSGPKVGSFTNGFAFTLTTVGGLVTALVIAELAATKPGEAPGSRVLDAATWPRAALTLKIVTGVYLLLWLALGLASFVVGAMWHPDVLRPLTDHGQSWLGLAVASGYAYFGVNQP